MALLLQGELIRGSTPLLSVPDGQPTKKVETDIMLSVEHLEVIPPPDRSDDLCTIYGYFRVSDKHNCAEPVNLFNRERDEAQTLDFGDPHLRFLPLSDDDTARPVFGGSPFYVQMKLSEKMGDDKVHDRVIAEIDFEFDDFYKTNRRSFLEFNGDFGFDFDMAYAHILCGVCAEIEFTIVKDLNPAGAEEEDSATATNKAQERQSKKRKQPMRIYGSIGATQSINKSDELPVIEIFHASDPIPVDIGSPVELRRKLLVVPTGGGCLGIAYSLFNAANDQLLTPDSVAFRIQRNDCCSVEAPEDLTYRQQSDDGLVSVSMTLVPYKYTPRPVCSSPK